MLDLTFVYEETAQLYSRKYGRPPIDPVIIVKYLLIGFLYGIPWERLDSYEEEGLETLKTRTGRRRKKRTRQIKKDTRGMSMTRYPIWNRWNLSIKG